MKLFKIKGTGYCDESPGYRQTLTLLVLAATFAGALRKLPRAVRKNKMRSWETDSVKCSGTIDA